nr:hypothetical protein [uncultured Marinifilum sp.]
MKKKQRNKEPNDIILDKDCLNLLLLERLHFDHYPQNVFNSIRYAVYEYDYTFISYLKFKLVPKGMVFDMLQEEIKKTLNKVFAEYKEFVSILTFLIEDNYCWVNNEKITMILDCLSSTEILAYKQTEFDLSDRKILRRYRLDNSIVNLPKFKEIVCFVSYLEYLGYLKTCYDNFDEEKEISPPQMRLCGFEAKLKDSQIEVLFDSLKGDYISEDADSNLFKALFKDEIIVGGKIKWIDKPITRPQKANLRTLFELFLLLLDMKYLVKDDVFSKMLGKQKINAIIDYCFYDGVADVPFINIPKGNESNTPTQKTDRHKKLKEIISNL